MLDPQGRPVEGAKVRASAGNEPQQLPDGWWEVEIAEAKVPSNGWVSVWAEHENWDGNRVDLHLENDPNPRAEVRLKEPETWIRGRVVDRADRALSGVRVFPQNGAPGVATTDLEGRFELKLSASREMRVRLRAEHAGFAPGDEFCYAGRDTCSILLEKR